MGGIGKSSEGEGRRHDLAFHLIIFTVFSLMVAPAIQESMPWLMWLIWVIATAATIALAMYIGYLAGKGEL